MVPAAKLAHSTESVVLAIFIIIWHFYHVHIERMNLSMFTGRLSEDEMREFHEKEYERLTGKLRIRSDRRGEVMRLRNILFMAGLVICFVSFGFAVSEASAGSGQGVEAAVRIICSTQQVDDSTCLACHNKEGFSVELDSGETLSIDHQLRCV